MYPLKSWGMVTYHQSLSSALVHYKLANYVSIKVLWHGDASPITELCICSCTYKFATYVAIKVLGHGEVSQSFALELTNWQPTYVFIKVLGHGD